MGMDYTVISAVRSRFGDKENDFKEMPFELTSEKNAPFVGVTKDFPFACPNVDRKQAAVLQFISFGIASSSGTLEINGVPISGGLSAGGQAHDLTPRIPLWNAHFLLVPANTLGESNELRIVSLPTQFGNRDDFVVDNIVITYKTLSNGGSPGGDVITN